MKQKALVQIQAVAVTAVHEPTVEVVLMKGILTHGMEADWEGMVIIINSLETLNGGRVEEFASINQPVILIIGISNPRKLQDLIGQNLTFSSERSIPVIDSLQSWQTESTT